MENTIHSEQELVNLWRLQTLLDWYPQEVAEKLAELPHVDLHQAVELRKQGCDPLVAADILA